MTRPAPEPLPPDLDELRHQLQQASREATALLENLDERQFDRRPEPDCWSVAECLTHLNRLGSYYLPRIDRAIEEARSRGLGRRGPFRPSLLWRWILAVTEPPVKVRIKTARAFQPTPHHSLDQVLADFRALQDGFVARLVAAREVDLGRARVGSPVSRHVRMSLGACFAILAAHQRRHLWQARQVLAAESVAATADQPAGSPPAGL